MASSISWKKIFDDYKILEHDFSKGCFGISAAQIKRACQDFKTTGEKEVRILCKQDSRSDRPKCFEENGLFLLPTKNGNYVIIKGEGYIDVPEIKTPTVEYVSQLDFELDSSKVGSSEMQHLDFAYASSLIRTFLGDSSLVLTIRGRKYTPKFSFKVGNHTVEVKSVQTEVDAGYEGEDKIVLVEAKNSMTTNTIIRQLFYPFKQWKSFTNKNVLLLFFEKQGNVYNIWQYDFSNENDYNSIKLVKSARYKILQKR
jgi:hypothetical protein